MKAGLATNPDEPCSTVVFSETRGKARARAMHTDACEDVDFCRIEVRRKPQLDKYYVEGKTEMDWYNSKDRVALVKECGFRCSYETLEYIDCSDCPAKQYCDAYIERNEG